MITFHRLRWATLALVPVAGMLAGLSGTAAADSGGRTVTYHGYRLTVPASWTVTDLDSNPHACVRLDRHAVYLGHPGADESCPPGLVGQVEALVVEPLAGATPAAGTVRLAAHRAAPATLPARTDHRLTFQVPSAGVQVTTAYGADPGALRAVLASARLTKAAKPAKAPSGPAAAPRAVTPQVVDPGTFAGEGFDACSAPSSATMQAWAQSPYRAVGVYIGGVNRSCAQPNLTAAWVSQQTGGGWHVLPIYVGLQAPCGSGSTINTGSAAAQGQAAAQDAVAKAQALGLDPGSVLYDDMENYARGGSCSQGVLNFLSAWTTQLHAQGYGSGVYSSASSGVTDLVAAAPSGYPEPDHIWFAHYDTGDNTTDPAIPADYWSNHQRIHQYTNGHNETWGGATVNIDNDRVDIAGAGTQPAPQSSPVNSQVFVAGSQQHFLGRGADGSLSHSWWDPNTGTANDSWAGPGSLAGEPVTMLAADGTQQHAWAVDAGGNLQHWWWSQAVGLSHDTWNTAASSGITLTGTPTGFLYGNQQHVWVRDNRGNLQHWWWSAAVGLSHDTWVGNGEVAADPQAILIGNQQHVFFVSTNGSLRHFWWNTSTVSNDTWGTGVTGKPTAFTAGSQQHVFVLDQAGDLRHFWWDPGSGFNNDTWNAAGSSGITLAGAPSGYLYGNQQHIWARDNHGNLQHWWWSQAVGLSHDTWVSNGEVAADPQTILISGNQQHVFFANTSGRLRHFWWNTSTISNDTWPSATLATG